MRGRCNLEETMAKGNGGSVAQRSGVIRRFGRVPKIVTAQRLQTWLLVAALVAIGLTALLVVDLARNDDAHQGVGEESPEVVVDDKLHVW